MSDKWDDITWAMLEELRIEDIDGDPDPEVLIATALRSAYAEGEMDGLEKAIQAIAMGRRKWGLGGILYAHIITAIRAAKETKE